MLWARRACATALALAAMSGPTHVAGVAREATEMDGASPARLTLASLSDWPGPRAQEYLPEAARGDTRRGGNEVRAGNGCHGSIALAVLTPPYTGVTLDRQPTLYWFLGADAGAPVEVELYGENAIDPLLTANYPHGLSAGIHALALADQGGDLELDVEYEWSVAVICDPDDPAGDIVSVGTIRRIVPPPGLERQLDGASLEERAQLLVEYGIWYDALQALAILIERHADREQWRSERARLLEQVGLNEAAAYEP